jgi:exosortase
MTTPLAALRPRDLLPLAPLALTAGIVAWVFWNTFLDLAQLWQTNAQYSHGFLVPVFAAALLYLRRNKLVVAEMKPQPWGLAILGAGLMIRLIGAYFGFLWLDPFSLIPCVAGLVLLLGGWAAWRWSWPAVLFLGFMLPLPWSVDTALAGPLQRLATVTSTFVMQVLGLPALAEGTVIHINEHQIGVVEACSGMKMLVVFFALSTAVILVSPRHWIDKSIILASAIPIALISNIFRVTVTGIMHSMGFSEMADTFFHDVAGLLMMPMGLGLLWVELMVLSYLFVDAPVPAARPAAVPASTRRKTAIARNPAARPAGPRPASKRRPASPPGRERRRTETQALQQPAPQEETPVEQGKQG